MGIFGSEKFALKSSFDVFKGVEDHLGCLFCAGSREQTLSEKILVGNFGQIDSKNCAQFFIYIMELSCPFPYSTIQTKIT